MRSMRILPLLAMISLPGCDGTGEWLRGQAAGTAYAAPLASDTSVVTTRRVWSAAPNTGSTIGISRGAIMPKGALIAATEWESGDAAIFDLASHQYRRFRWNDEAYDTGFAMDPVVSPDGSQIVFQWHPGRAEGQLRVFDVATRESRIIMAPDSGGDAWLIAVAWTPAGDSVFAIAQQRGLRRKTEVVLIPVAGGTPRLVHAIPSRATPRRMGVSSDGRWLVYEHGLSRNQDTRSDIYIIDVKDGGARPLIDHPGIDVPVGWLPGSDVVLFSSDRSGTTDLWSVRVANGRASGEPRLVRSGFFRSEAVGFADGALFYTVRTGSFGQAVIDVDPQSGALLGAASPPLEHLSTLPRAQAWSVDGRTLAVPRAQGGGHAVTLHSMDTGHNRVFWLDEDVHPLAVGWAADGTSLILRVAEAPVVPTGPHYFLRLDLVTGTTMRLFAGVDQEDLSAIWRFLVTPDGRSIVLRQRRTFDDGRTEMKLVLRSLEDGSERVLHRTAGFIPEFSLSEDGTRLAFVQQVWEQSDSLFIMRMDGQQPLRYIASWVYDAVSLLGWLPAGNALLAARLTEDRTGEEILRIALDGSTTVVGISPFRPMRGAPVQGYNRSRLVLSPAGNRLTHAVSAVGEELWRMDGLHQLFATDAAVRR
jgi:Tol biopolymer transport system component